MPLYVTSHVTTYNTRIIPSLVGIITRYYTVVEETDEKGNKVVATRIVDEVTVPVKAGKTVVVPTKSMARRLKKVATAGTLKTPR